MARETPPSPSWRMEVARARERLTAAGFLNPGDEARLLATAAGQSGDRLEELVGRRTTGEPLPWILGWVDFCGIRLAIVPGVYVPRPQTEPLARRAARRLPSPGLAVDLGTGCGAIARVLGQRRPEAAVLGTESDPGAARCARANSVEVVEGDLYEGLPDAWRGRVDVIVGALPYVPDPELPFLAHDVLAFEPRQALEGGPDGLRVLRRAVLGAAVWLRPGGRLLLELGAGQPQLLGPALESAGLRPPRLLVDSAGDVRGIEALWPG